MITGLNQSDRSDRSNGRNNAAVIRWGILGTGNIARQFAEGLKSARGAVLQAVAYGGTCGGIRYLVRDSPPACFL